MGRVWNDVNSYFVQGFALATKKFTRLKLEKS